MQNRFAIPLRYNIKEKHAGSHLSAAQHVAVDWAKVDDYHAILDLDCANGNLLRHYMERFHLRACGISKSMEALHQADVDVLLHAEILKADQHDIPWMKNSFDVVFLTKLIYKNCRCDQLMSEVHRVLKPGAQFVLVVPGSPLLNRLTHLLKTNQSSQFWDNPIHLMDRLNHNGFVDVSMRSSRLRYTTIIAHKQESTS
ncbi:MAG: class I SAM-dependent methyltransferase [Christensenellales bacterium]|jgi:SAM-dependent methyltransferase